MVQTSSFKDDMCRNGVQLLRPFASAIEKKISPALSVRAVMRHLDDVNDKRYVLSHFVVITIIKRRCFSG